MLDRHLHRTVTARLRHAPAVVLLGPRQVGKTTLARAVANSRRHAVYLDLEDPADSPPHRSTSCDRANRSQDA